MSPCCRDRIKVWYSGRMFEAEEVVDNALHVIDSHGRPFVVGVGNWVLHSVGSADVIVIRASEFQEHCKNVYTLQTDPNLVK